MQYFPIQRYAGLDLGQRQDHSALALLEVCVPPTGPRDPYTGGFHRPIRFHLRHLDRYPLGLTYPALAGHVRSFLNQPPLKNCPLTLIVDATGPGLPPRFLRHHPHPSQPHQADHHRQRRAPLFRGLLPRLPPAPARQPRVRPPERHPQTRA